MYTCVCVCASRSCNRLIRDLPRHGNMAWMRCWVSEARRSLIHFARTAASKLKSNCTPHTHSAHTLHTHSGHASSCGNQNDDVKIFVHWACRFHFEPNGSISLHLFLYLYELRLSLTTGEPSLAECLVACLAKPNFYGPNCHGPLKRTARGALS